MPNLTPEILDDLISKFPKPKTPDWKYCTVKPHLEDSVRHLFYNSIQNTPPMLYNPYTPIQIFTKPDQKADAIMFSDKNLLDLYLDGKIKEEEIT